MRDIVMTWASGETFCNSEGFAVYLSSWKEITNPHCEKVVLTNDMPASARTKVVEAGGVVIDHTGPIHYLLRDRHLAFYEYLASIKEEARILITDCKDVVFHDDPIWYACQMYPVKGIVLVSEGMKHRNSGWNMIDQYEAQVNVREFRKDMSAEPIINGGVMYGDKTSMMDLLLLLWSNTVRVTGKCTDQAVLNYLVPFLQKSGKVTIVDPHRDKFCLTGEAVKENFIWPKFEKGRFIPSSAISMPFCMVHQWERTKYKDEVLAHYLK